MKETITIVTLRKWMKAKFGNGYMYLPDTTPLKCSNLRDLNFHKKSKTFRLRSYAPKALLLGHREGADQKPVWAVFRFGLQFIYYYVVSTEREQRSWNINFNAPNLSLQYPLDGDRTSIGAFLIFFFLGCGAITEFKTYNGFYDELERAFRRHIARERDIADKAEQTGPVITCSHYRLQSLTRTVLNLDCNIDLEFSPNLIQVSLIENAVAIGRISGENIPTYALVRAGPSRKISYCFTIGKKTIQLELRTTFAKSITIREPFCDVFDNIASAAALRRLKALVCYINIVSSNPENRRERQGYAGFEEDFMECMKRIIEAKNMELTDGKRQPRSRVVSALIFRENLSDKERFELPISNAEVEVCKEIPDSKIMPPPADMKDTDVKRALEESDGEPAETAKRAKLIHNDSTDHDCHEIHEKVVSAYSEALKLCNQFRNEKTALEKRISELDDTISNQTEVIAKSGEWKLKFEDINKNLDEEIAKAKEWKLKFENAEKELVEEKAKAEAGAQRAREEAEAEAAMLERQVQEIIGAAAKKRAKITTT